MGSLTLASNLSAQEVALPMGRTIGAACTHSVTVPAQGGPALSFPPLPQSTGAPPEPTRLVKVRDDVYAVINANNAVVPDIPLYGGNVAIYLTDDGAVLVDSKTERMHDDLVAKVRSLTDAPLKYVVLTHHHADHSGGAARLQALGARVIMSAADAQRMGAPGQPGVPQMSYEGHAVIALGGKRIDLLEFCGHTSGDTVVYLSDARVVVSGDLVATPASIPPIVNYADGGNWTDLVRTLDVLAALDFDFMIAGHGPVLTKQQFLEYRDKITAIRVRAQELVRAEQSADEIAQALGAEFAWGSGPAADNIPGMMLELR
jgi:glyoxylase-like metal-dependent hydrolase (beta-lactamase superfamily II)